jgi:hypothetical protein
VLEVGVVLEQEDTVLRMDLLVPELVAPTRRAEVVLLAIAAGVDNPEQDTVEDIVVDLGQDSLVVDSKGGPEVGLLLGIVVAPEEKSGWWVRNPRRAVAGLGLAKPVPAVRSVAGDIRGSCNRVPDLPFPMKKSVKCYFNELVRILLLRQSMGAEEDGKLWGGDGAPRTTFRQTQETQKLPR